MFKVAGGKLKISGLLLAVLFIFGCATTNPPVVPAGSRSASSDAAKLTPEKTDGEENFKGSIDKEGIRQAIRDDRRSIHACYNGAIKRNKDAKGKIEISWEINDAGKVPKSSVWSNNTGDEELAQCVRKRLSLLKYPAPPKGELAQIIFPFVFESTGELSK